MTQASSQVVFKLQLSDYAAAYVAHQTLMPQRGKAKDTTNWQWVVLGLVFVAALIVILLDAKPSFSQISLPLWSAADSNYHAYGPWVLLIGIILLYRLSARFPRWLVATALVIILAIDISSFVYGSYYRIAQTLGGLTWLIVFSFWFSAWSVLVTSRSLHHHWKKMQYLHGYKTLSWDVRGFSVEDPDMTIGFRWTALKAWKETRELLLLYIDDGNFQIIPIRAFPDPQMLEQFRATFIEASKARTSAFPVILK